MISQDPKLWMDPKLDYTIPDPALPFSHYLQHCHKLLQHRLDLSDNAETILNANSPFEWQPKNPAKNGVLLIHGLLDSPFTLHDLGRSLQQQGLLVRSILLPGHGICPGALLTVTYQAWLETVAYALTCLANEVEKIFILGYSTGASLAIYHALTQRTPKLKGIIAIAPAIKIYSRFAFAANWHKAISWAWQRALWLDIAEENNYSKYQSIAFNPVYQVYRLSQKIQQIKTPLTVPTYFIVSATDKTIDSQACLHFLRQQHLAKHQMLLYSPDHINYIDQRITTRPVTYPELRIKDISHIALPIAPENLFYGQHGSYQEASRLVNNQELIYGSFNRLEVEKNKRLYLLGYAKNLVQALSYNPDFTFMQQSIFKFINSLS